MTNAFRGLNARRQTEIAPERVRSWHVKPASAKQELEIKSVMPGMMKFEQVQEN